MSSPKKIHSTFSFDWIVKSTSYNVKFRKAYEIDEIDEILCSIIEAKGISICQTELGELLGFNLSDVPEEDKFKDIAEEAVLNEYLQQLLEYGLIKKEDKTLFITDLGKEALTTKLKYKFIYASVNLFENVSIKGENLTFSFREIFGLKSQIDIIRPSESSIIIEDSLFKKRLQFQLFENDKFKGELLEVYESNSPIGYSEFKLTGHLLSDNDNFKLFISKEGVDKLILCELINESRNIVFQNKLIHKGKFQYIMDSETPIKINDILEYIDLWNWEELAKNSRIDWSEEQIFDLFKNKGNRNVWKNISENTPIEKIESVIQLFIEYWDWRILTQRFDTKFIFKTINDYKWDFEELSYKEKGLVVNLLSLTKFKLENWDWQYLTQELPDEFAVGNINNFPWDFHLLTTTKFEVFKTVFNSDIERQLLNPWNWNYISQEIKVGYLFQNIEKFANHINWNTILERFFNDEDIANKCVTNQSFKSLLKTALPENFIISHQNYNWSINTIAFFDELNLINWETTSYSKGFDSNRFVTWNEDIFNKYFHKINSEQGYSTVSSSITDYNLLRKHPTFNWDWEEISKNKTLVSDVLFITKIITQKTTISSYLNWGEIFNFHEISFWNKHLSDIEKHIPHDKGQPFWQQLTSREEFGFILSNYNYPWDWKYVTENSSSDIIIKSFEDKQLIEKWDWNVATTKLSKTDIVNNLEIGTPFWDWDFIIKNIFTVSVDLKLEDGILANIASCISVLDDEKKKEIWKILTSVFPIDILYNYIDATSTNITFEWDWDYISGHKHIPTDLVSLNKFKYKLNWTILSDNDSIKTQFNQANWGDDKKGYLVNLKKYLNQFLDKWNWKVLSTNPHLNWNRNILRDFVKQDWDWDYLSEYGDFLKKGKNDTDDYLVKLLNQFPIDYASFSKRQNLIISSNTIQAKANENWDWIVLSQNPKAEISSSLLVDLKEKNWDWITLSKNSKVEISNETIFKLIDKNWDWNSLSNRSKLIFDLEFLSKTLSKTWNWKVVSNHKSFIPTLEILTLTQKFELDWKHLSKHSDLNPTRELLAKFEDKWDWNHVSKQKSIDFKDIDLILRFIDKWDWTYLCESGKIDLNKETLVNFKEYLDWDLLSQNTSIEFTKELIQEYKPFWNWNHLKNNNRINELLGDYVQEIIEASPKLRFINKIAEQYSPWKGSAYHFSNIDNAIQIIKNRKIQSRNKANILGDAAGNVVHRRSDAHEYSRFYFRPHTPTQFYNEFLGKNTNDGYRNNNSDTWVSWYEKARGLGFPKCPLPIFFRFSIQEILLKTKNKCCISNGNMQTTSTSFGSIESMIDKFGFEDLFYTPGQYSTKEDYNRYRDFAQQEFLIQDELGFDELNNFEIVCPTETDKKLLISLIGNENREIFSKIVVDSSYYNNENPRIRITNNETETRIESEFKGEGYLNLYPSIKIDPNSIITGDIERINNDKLIFKSHLVLNNYHEDFKVTFTDESKREWFVYSNKTSKSLNLVNEFNFKDFKVDSLIASLSNLSTTISQMYNSTVRHYKLLNHTKLVCNQFEKYFLENNCKINLNLFRVFLALHDIGKPMAFKNGNKDNQFRYTIEIITSIWKNLPFNQQDLQTVLSLVSNDCLGEYYQEKLSIEVTKKSLIGLSKKTNLSIFDFLKLYMVYYQCDTAAYTADAGGLKFLEHLFEYKDGEKVFDKDEELIKFSPKYWKMYLNLKNEIELCL